jgi:hypothetical protein
MLPCNGSHTKSELSDEPLGQQKLQVGWGTLYPGWLGISGFNVAANQELLAQLHKKMNLAMARMCC